MVSPLDHCRIGSLEILLGLHGAGVGRSLPHRQLRKNKKAVSTYISGSLPHRQLRNVYTGNCICMR